MMSRPKLVYCMSAESPAISRKYTIPWSDTYIQFSVGKNRTEKWGPTIIGKATLLIDIAIDREMMKKYPPEDYKEDLEKNEAVLRLLVEQEVVVSSPGEPLVQKDGNKIPSIFVREDHLNRATIEKALRALMKEIGYESVRFKWRRAKFLIVPVSF